MTTTNEVTGAGTVSRETAQDKANREMLEDDARANAQLVLTADQQLLLSEIQRMNAQSRTWQAEGPDRVAFLLTEDMAHWSRFGINSVADFDEMQRLEDAKEARKNAYADYAEEYERNETAHAAAIARYMKPGEPLTFTPFAFAL